MRFFFLNDRRNSKTIRKRDGQVNTLLIFWQQMKAVPKFWQDLVKGSRQIAASDTPQQRSKEQTSQISERHIKSVAAAIYFFLEKSIESAKSILIEKIFDDREKEMLGRAEMEAKYLYLQIYAFQSLIHLIFKDDPRTRDLMATAFLDFVANESIRVLRQHPDHFRYDYINRCLEYAKALDTPHHNGPAFMIGKTFSKFCAGSEHSAIHQGLGSALFTNIVSSYTEPLESAIQQIGIKI